MQLHTAASWPVMASTTSRTSVGFTAFFYFFQLVHHHFVYLMIEKIIHLASVVMVKLKASSMKNYVSLKDT
jgi:hypothetical protein